MTSGPETRSRALVGPAVRRVVASAGVAGALGLAFWLVIYIGSRSHVTAGLACGGGPWGCLGLAIVGILAGVLAIFVFAWPLLHLAGIRPAWPVALLGPIVAVATYEEFVKLAGRALLPELWLVLATSYAAAAVITAPRFYRYWSAVVAVTVVALDFAFRFVGIR